MKPLIDYGDIIYEQPQNESFGGKLESIRYKAALVITGAIQGTSREKIYQELGLESLKSRRWYKRLSCMFQIMNNEAPNSLLNLITKSQQTNTTRNNHIPNYHCRTDFFKYSFLTFTLKDWFNLNASKRNSESFAIFKSRLLSFIRQIQSNVYNIFDPIGMKLQTHLRSDCSHLNEHKFQDCLNSLYCCSLEIEDTVHYLLHRHHFSQYRFDVINNVKSISDDFESFF